MTAENRPRRRRRRRRRRRFNEAAADDRGKPDRDCHHSRSQPERFNEAAADDRGKPVLSLPRPFLRRLASMRPRPMTAENHGPRVDRLQ